jgi:hypothetical protein
VLGFEGSQISVSFDAAKATLRKGDTAIEILRLTSTMSASRGGGRSARIRGSFTAHRENGTWKLLGAQYTDIRPAPTSAAK